MLCKNMLKPPFATILQLGDTCFLQIRGMIGGGGIGGNSVNDEDILSPTNDKQFRYTKILDEKYSRTDRPMTNCSGIQSLLMQKIHGQTDQ